MEVDRYDLAERELKSAIESRPELKESYIVLAELYAKTNRVADATDILTKADLMWPENLIIRLKLATAWAKSSRFKEAERGYKWVLKRAPLATAALNGLGNIYMMQREYKLALSYYESAIKLRPDEPEAFYNAALVLEELGDFKRASELYTLFIKAASDSTTPYGEAIRRSKQRLRTLKESG
jgi:tetratricopeptide (TPR) repeat protein